MNERKKPTVKYGVCHRHDHTGKGKTDGDRLAGWEEGIYGNKRPLDQ